MIFKKTVKMKILFNPQYILKPDLGRALILPSQVGRSDPGPLGDSFETVIHPIHAMLLSLCDGREMEAIVAEACSILNLKSNYVEAFYQKILTATTFVRVRTKAGESVIPPHSILEYYKDVLVKRFNPAQFSYKNLDLCWKRHNTPTSITLMVNNLCHTDCIYCYADKRKKVNCNLPISRIEELIDEAKSLNVRTFDVIGGEFFLYKEWKRVLKTLHTYGYHPYLSTKLPLSEDDVMALKSLGVQDIQLSLDSLMIDPLKETLKVGDSYVERIKNTLFYFEKYGIPVYLHSVISKRTATVESINSIFDYIKGFKCIKEWKIDKAEKSMYAKVPYELICPTQSSMMDIASYLDRIKNNASFQIRYPRPQLPNQYILGEETDFFSRGLCSGNYSSLFILPDGKVTICEELYWHPHFILGDVTLNSIKEIWESEKAISLYKIKQSAISPKSLCHNCPDFEKCRSLRQVCYKEIVKKYGEDCWDYPDPGCPKIKQLKQ